MGVETIFDQFETKKNEYMMFVGDNASYYINKFSKIKQSGNKGSWNWSAFIFCTYWLIYRKMYTWGFVVAGIGLATSSMAISGFIGTGLSIYIGIMGNSIYLNHIEKELAEANNLDEDAKQQLFREIGGTSMGAVFGFISVIIIGALIIYYA